MATIKPSDIPDLSLQAFQPRNIHTVPLARLAPVNWLFQATWFNRFNWLHYNSSNLQQVWSARVWYLPEPGSTHLKFFNRGALWQWTTVRLWLLQRRSVNESTPSTAISFETSSSRSSGNKQSRSNEKEIVSVLAGLSTAEKVALSSVLTAVKLLLVMPATNSTSERSFSALRRVKTYLRRTMIQQRLNSLMVLHVHKASTDCLDLMEVAQELVAGREGRLRMFGDCRQ